jgi:hypothetical protein
MPDGRICACQNGLLDESGVALQYDAQPGEPYSLTKTSPSSDGSAHQPGDYDL